MLPKFINTQPPELRAFNQSPSIAGLLMLPIKNLASFRCFEVFSMLSLVVASLVFSMRS